MARTEYSQNARLASRTTLVALATAEPPPTHAPTLCAKTSPHVVPQGLNRTPAPQWDGDASEDVERVASLAADAAKETCVRTAQLLLAIFVKGAVEGASIGYDNPMYAPWDHNDVQSSETRSKSLQHDQRRFSSHYRHKRPIGNSLGSPAWEPP